MTIAVVGTGYVGLVSAACFAELGHTVWGIDIDPKKIAMLTQGKSPLYEPGLGELIIRGLQSGRLQFGTDLVEALPSVQIVFCAVGTPPGESFKADLRAVFAVADTVARSAQHELLFINKSTVPVGTGKQCEERMRTILRERGILCAIPVVSNPEFLREGVAVSDTLSPDRIIVGLNGDETTDAAQTTRGLIEELYSPITRVGKPLLFMSRESAELVKYASNAFLATKISFINMLTPLCEKTGGDIREIAVGMGLDHRIGAAFLHAGIGYGGSCFPKDVKALLATGDDLGIPLSLIKATDDINEWQRQRFTDTVLSHLPPAAHVAVWGLSFKPKTDDMRDAPSIDIISALIREGHGVTAYDPAAMDTAKPVLPPETRYAQSPLEATENADALLLLTEWNEFRGLSLEKVRSVMKGMDFFDGRNIFQPSDVARAGLRYHGIGIGSLPHSPL